MSEPETPEIGLAVAREQLARKGYLRSSLPPTGSGRVGGLLHGFAIAVAAAVIAAWTATASTGAPVAMLLPVAAGLLPLVAGVVAAAMVVGPRLAGLGLRAGLGPAAVAGSLAALAGAGVLVLVALASGPAIAAPSALALPWLSGVALGVEATWAARASVLRRVSLVSVTSPRPPGLLVAMAVVVVIGAFLAVPRLVGGRTAAPPPAASFPQADGRVAVVAVDGLAREDLDALRSADGTAWSDLGSWGWAPIRTPLPQLPAVLWSTVATGVGPQRHGVVVLDEVRLFGSERGVPLRGPIRAALLAVWRPLGLARVVARPSLQRSAPTFWEMASRAGVPVSVGGWWGSWPVRRVLGDVASERAWLSGSSTADAVTPGVAPLVKVAWSGVPDAATASDRLALSMAERAGSQPGPHLVALWLPGLDLVRRAAPVQPPLALAARSTPHLEALRDVISVLSGGGYEVWVVAVPWAGGTAFAASSAASRREHPSVDPRALAATWLGQLGLPPPLGVMPGRSDLVGDRESTGTQVSYGPPPPPLTAPPRAALEVQREVLRSLGYLQ